MSTYRGLKASLVSFNQEKALVGAFTVIVKTDCETDRSSAALFLTVTHQIVFCVNTETFLHFGIETFFREEQHCAAMRSCLLSTGRFPRRVHHCVSVCVVISRYISRYLDIYTVSGTRYIHADRTG